MHKLLLWTTYVASALATFNKVIPVAKRDTNCTNSQQISQKNAQDENVVQVSVGFNGTLTYSPDDGPSLTNLPLGTVIQFNFLPKNHTVTESTFDEPCKPIAANITQAKGRDPIKTGFVPVNGSETFTKAFRIKLTDTKPIWLYCGQTKHCQSGMVMVINQNTSDTTDKTLANFKAKAANVVPPSASSSSSVVPPSSTTVASVDPVTPAATTTAPVNGPSLAATATAASSSALVSVFNGQAVPTQRPMRLAAMGGLAVAGAVAFL